MAVVLNLACKAMNVSYKRTCVEMITVGRGDSAFEVASDNKVVSCSCSEHQVKSSNWRPAPPHICFVTSAPWPHPVQVKCGL